jgi:hypothetical protein
MDIRSANTTVITSILEHRIQGDPSKRRELAEPSVPSTNSMPTITGTKPTLAGSYEKAPQTAAVPAVLQSNWSKIAKANMSNDLYASLIRIARASGPGIHTLKLKSLQNFLAFWVAVRDDAAEPELGLGPDGSIFPEWFKSHKQRLDVRFTDQRVFFGLFANNDILEGASSLDDAAKTLMAHHAKPLSWRQK